MCIRDRHILVTVARRIGQQHRIPCRDPNKHIAFGYGVHFCLGAALARMEVNSFFSALLPRLTSVELAGPPEHTATIFVGGLKHLPIRYELSG